MSKDNTRLASLRLTQSKRKTQTCKTFEVKIKSCLLSKTQKEFLTLCFLEAKWLWNDIVRSTNVYCYDSKNKVITRLDKDRMEFKYTLRFLPAAMRQDILAQMKSNIKTLVTLKKKNKVVGQIRFCREKSILPLRQHGNMYTLIHASERIKIQGCKKPFPVSGLHQIPSHYEIANARIVAKATGYFIQIVTYHNKGKEKLSKHPKSLIKREALGLDFGIKNTVTTSEGSVFSAYIEETERLKRLQRKLSRQQKRSNNWLKTLKKIKIEYQKLTNRKDDLSKKFVHKLLEENEKIVIQDDNFATWNKSKHHWGRKIQHGCLGRIKMLLKQHPEQVIVIGRFEATTKRCHICDTIIEGSLELDMREFVCPKCDLKMNRDEQAARMILKLGMLKHTQIVGVERTERARLLSRKKPVENIEDSLFNEAGIARG